MKKQKKPQKSAPRISAKEKIVLMIMTIIIGIMCLGLMAATAYAANIKFEINKLEKQNKVILGEIENLNVKVSTANNLPKIEEQALTMGMVHPDPMQFVFLENIKQPTQEFAMILREEAYN